MKMRNKGKVHPFISSSSNTQNKDPNFSVLKLLPAAIFTLLSVLSLEDREVLAYMITRSLKSTTNYSSSLIQSRQESHEKSSKETQCCPKSPALFECDCFHCYTIFWFRWDSSPNRDLILRAIEAFEDHLNSNGGQIFKKSSGTGKNSKRKDKNSRRKSEKLSGGGDVVEVPAPEGVEDIVVSPEVGDAAAESEVVENFNTAAAVVRGHKGLAWKVLPDVIGIFNSRLWSLWSPNV